MLKTIMVMPDLHAPYHSKAAWRLFLKCVDTVKPDFFVNIGDFVDTHVMTRHVKDPERENLLRKELAKPRAMLRDLEYHLHNANPRVAKIWTLGNHDTWLDKRIAEKMPELSGLLSIPSLLDVTKKGEGRQNWELVPYGQHIRIGKLYISHEFGHAGKNCGRDTLLAVGDNVCFGHSHRASVTYGGTALGQTHVSLNVGWLGDPKAATYAHQAQKARDWQHGFGLIYLEPNGVVHAHFVPFIGNHCVIPQKPTLVRA